MFQKLFAWLNKYERHLSALAMVAGFAVDNFAFKRVDVPMTQVVFLSYALACFLSIAGLHIIETRAERGYARPRWRVLLPLITQFALGGFWSGFLIFYSRSAVLATSWPFLLLLVVVFFGNEILKKYHDRLVFTSVLFFFALYSYAIFAVPIVTGKIGTITFLESGAAAIFVFALFTITLRVINRARFANDVWRIRVGAFLVLFLVNAAYFTGVLPPLPLALSQGGIYHAVSRTGDVYTGLEESQSWKTSIGFPVVLHTVPNESLYAYSAVFAPIKLSTTIVHNWQWYDPTTKTWVTKSAISFPIAGGRDGGYRGYSTKANPQAGEWRVDVETGDGRLVGRLRFTVIPASLPPIETEKTLN